MISIIGGGPSGAYLASLLGDKAEVFEEHKEIGKPIQCTGILTHSVKDLIPIKEDFVVNRIKRIKLISPGNESHEFNLKEPELIVNRSKFDRHLIESAQDKGAKISLGQRLKDISLNNNRINLKFDHKEIKTDNLVGADGPNSLVARKIGLLNGRKYRVGHQYVVEGEFDPEVFTVYFNGVKHYFGWIVPESESKARVGIVGDANISQLFQEFLNKVKIDKKYFVECQSGTIPVYDYGSKACKDKVYLVGDAAGHVKATTLGGIVYGMRASKILARVLDKGGDYDAMLRKEIGRDLWLHSKAANLLSGFGKEGFDDFIKLLKKVELGKFNRDKPWSGIGLFVKPGLVWFLAKQFLKQSEGVIQTGANRTD
jgi:digeranylgeranylglycerophospholipid reductase